MVSLSRHMTFSGNGKKKLALRMRYKEDILGRHKRTQHTALELTLADDTPANLLQMEGSCTIGTILLHTHTTLYHASGLRSCQSRAGE